MGLDAFEAQMTYGPRTTPENCSLMRSKAQEFNIQISIHASYFIVLTSSDPLKIQKSFETLKKTYDLAQILGAKTIVLHPGSLYELSSEQITETLITNLKTYFQTYGQSDIGLFLETAGKRGQFGSVEEIFETCRAVEGTFPCIDFGHVHARTGGTLDSDSGIDGLFASMGDLGRWERMHFHYTPIHWGPRGEIQHRAIEDDGFFPKHQRVVEQLSRLSGDFTIISETHDSQERGAGAMKSHYHTLSR